MATLLVLKCRTGNKQSAITTLYCKNTHHLLKNMPSGLTIVACWSRQMVGCVGCVCGGGKVVVRWSSFVTITQDGTHPDGKKLDRDL